MKQLVLKGKINTKSSKIDGDFEKSIIKLLPQNEGISKIKVDFSGVTKYLIFDTGASDLIIDEKQKMSFYTKKFYQMNHTSVCNIINLQTAQ